MATSNPTLRVVGLLNVLIRQQHRGVGLTELAREVGMSKGTCLAIADTLVEQGYLVQHAKTRAYRLGPALITAGQAVLSGFIDLKPALGCLARLAADFDVSCPVLAVDQDQLVVIERVGSPNPTYRLGEVGSRMPFAPPWGAPFVAWSSENELDAWLGRSLVPLTDDAVSKLWDALRTGRRRGYLVTREIPPTHPASTDLRLLRTNTGAADLAALRRLAEARLSNLGYFVNEVDPVAIYPVNHVAVPILAATGRVAAILLATMFGRQVAGADVERLGKRMVEVAVEVAARAARPYRLDADPC
jgi:DNA-binding IclR family transcriptional regulator